MTDYLSILKRYWGFDSFRGIQRDIIESIGAGHDTLGLMPTGGGKSITFQVPALAMEGVCIVITPLIALMKDQVAHLRRLHIRAAAIHSGLTREQTITILENSIFGGVKILYVSPERLSSELFQKKLSHMKVSFITVDEAHCISQWGYDFRPSYLDIANIRLLANVPILALTATATPKVIDDIQDKLSIHKDRNAEGFNVFRMSYERKNLAYIVRHVGDKYERLVNILETHEGCTIIYVRSRRRTKEIADFLQKRGISALAYHAGLDDQIRDERQREWHDDRVRVMVATNAFGMGIDKPDVRLVIHFDCPDSLEAYFQEAGRAGRDGQQSYAIMLYNASDGAKLRRRFTDTYPEKDYIRQVYEHLAYYYQIALGSGFNTVHEFNIDRFCYAFKHFPVQVESALNILTRAGYIEYSDERENRARVMFTIGRDDLYLLQSQTEKENRVITALLRNYSGLFSDYQFIDEAFIAQQAGFDNSQSVYLILKNLNDKRILSFIPQRKTPHIRYTRSREEMQHLIFPPEIYEERKKQYKKRLDEVIEYATNNSVCRSRQLLRYFGETSSHDCHQCDVCLSNGDDKDKKEEERDARKKILEFLADGKLHPITDIYKIKMPHERILGALRFLLLDEAVYMKDSFIVIAS
ncbi:MAG: RecQ family ATP-dependent DNA helicase [Prevotella sp.]|nr:RecQ family ATP-dependent DNA helicase [Prevotella sp.]